MEQQCSFLTGKGCPQCLAGSGEFDPRCRGVIGRQILLRPLCSASIHCLNAQKPVGVCAACPCPPEDAACWAAFCFSMVQSNV